MDKENKYTEAFYRAQKELNHDGFVSWICQAYGSLTVTDKGKMAKINLKVINEAIDFMSKQPAYSKR